ncbi:hypothetical protein [Streptomyces asoensis]|uniref:hypothetical protein n=1 Tax=Streptomyces asoensis TaxID=249586 RepID=UPI00340723FC
MQGLVVVPAGKRLSELDRLRRSPRDITARGVGKALFRGAGRGIALRAGAHWRRDRLIAITEPGDSGEPVMSLMLPDEM